MRLLASLAWIGLASTAAAQTAVWYRRPTASTPPSGMRWELGYDAARRLTVAIGVDTQNVETWEFDGVDWARRTPPARPEANSYFRFVEMTGAGLRLVANKQNRQTEIWRFDGQTWVRLSAATLTPSGRNAPAVAWDSRRGVLVLHGGDVGGQGLADTWEWDGVAWRQRSTGGPLPRNWHDLAFDPVRGEVVLFGGFNGSIPFADTWLWNGSYWVERFGIPGPSARWRHHMYFDPARGRTVVFGGLDLRSNGVTDSFDWDGTAWTAHLTGVRPPDTGSIAYDSLRNVAVALIEVSPTTTWELALLPSVPGRWTAFGAACATSAGLPQFGNVTPAPYVGEVFQAQVANVPSHPLFAAVGMLGASRTVWNGIALPIDLGFTGMTGCSLLVAPALFLPLARAGGVVPWSLTIPLDHALAGAAFYQQVVLADPGINPLGLATTTGGDAVVGRR